MALKISLKSCTLGCDVVKVWLARLHVRRSGPDNFARDSRVFQGMPRFFSLVETFFYPAGHKKWSEKRGGKTETSFLTMIKIDMQFSEFDTKHLFLRYMFY